MQPRTDLAKRARYGILALLAAGASALPPWTADAGSLDAAAACSASDPDTVITGCTELILVQGVTDSRLSAALNNRGTAFSAKGAHKLALSDFTMSARLDATNDAPHQNLCFGWLNVTDGERVVAACSEAIRRSPATYEAWANRSLGHVLLGRLDHALADVDKALDLNPQCALAHANRGSLLEQLGRAEDAIRDYERALELDPALDFPREKLRRLRPQAGLGQQRGLAGEAGLSLPGQIVLAGCRAVAQAR